MVTTPDKPAGASSRRAVTITSIARRAGVSHSTVSLVLNDRVGEMRIHPDTAERIRKIAAELNYVPNHLARGLRGKATRNIGVLWSLCGPHHSEGVTRRLTLLAQRQGYSTSIADSLSDVDVTCAGLADFKRRGVDGVILQWSGMRIGLEERMHNLLRQFRSVVTVGAYERAEWPWDHVIHVYTDAIHEAIAQQVRHGRRHIAFIGDGRSSQVKQTNLINAVDAAGLDSSGIQWIDFTYRIGETTPRDVYDVLDRHVASSGAGGGAIPFDVLMCSCDETAAAAISWLGARGLRVPDDAAVIGFNGSDFGAFFVPPIASVARREDVVADAAVELLMARLADPSLPPQRRTVSMTYVPRASAST